MKSQNIHAYVPEEFLLRNKEELPCHRFREDLAIVSYADDCKILTCRGPSLHTGSCLAISENEKRIIDLAISTEKTAAVLADGKLLLVFTELFAKTGLLCVSFPHGNATTLAKSLLASEVQGVLCSDALLTLAASGVKCENTITELIEEFYLFRRILIANPNTEFRLHNARIAEIAGCRVDVRTLPIGVFPIDWIDFSKWTAFLLCAFLALRGDSALDTQIHLNDATRREFSLQVSHISEHPQKTPIEDERFAFLRLPCFSGYHLSKTKNGFVLDTALCRQKQEPFAVHSDSWNDYFCMLFLLAE
jgi:hypothetical protein